ncbi:hypothetical protein DEO72_LG3g2110 [Vigna unguiculata]|uniref:Uncharacterized protein n=1 Tax=Vigna unguiculata TaxID=3917 RepID=A0A4D6LGE2_VIGUN|nr:hypothetical protein DEO72_LG3g2110 [Vigna unguiculata]
MSQGTCLTTLLRHKNISLTKVRPATNPVEINNVLISNPNIFLADELAVHGVLSPFSPLHPHDLLQRSLDFFIRPPLVLPTTPSPRTVFTGTASFTCSVQRATLRSPSHCVLCLYFSATSLSRRFSSTSHASTAPTMLHHRGILR